MLFNKSCTCGGNNEKCYKCFGSGFVSIDPPEPKSGVLTNKIQKNQENFKSKNGKSKTDSKPKIVVYKILEEKTILAKPILSPHDIFNNTNTKCPECGCVVGKNKLIYHLRKIHNKKPPSAKLYISADGKRVWRVGGVAKSSTMKKDNNSLTNPDQLVSSIKHKWTESNLDGSRDYYNNYREKGNQLGSHPSHDDYGDESIA
jgi:hypothetical protein